MGWIDDVKEIVASDVVQRLYSPIRGEERWRELEARLQQLSDVQTKFLDVEDIESYDPAWLRSSEFGKYLEVVPYRFVPVAGQSVDGRVAQPTSLVWLPNSWFILSGYNSAPAMYDSDWSFRGVIGTYSNSPGNFYQTRSLATYTDANGRLWLISVHDGRHVVQFFLLDGFSISYQFHIGTWGSGGLPPAALWDPRQVAIDAANKRLYVACYNGQPAGATYYGYVAVYDISGLDNATPTAPTLVDIILAGTGPSASTVAVNRPTGVYYSNGKLWVSNSGFGSLDIYDVSGATPIYVMSAERPVEFAGLQVELLSGIVTPSTELIAAVDATISRALVWDSNGNLLHVLGRRGITRYSVDRVEQPLILWGPRQAYLYETGSTTRLAVVDYDAYVVWDGPVPSGNAQTEIEFREVEFTYSYLNELGEEVTASWPVKIHSIYPISTLPCIPVDGRGRPIKVLYSVDGGTTWHEIDPYATLNLSANRIKVKLIVSDYNSVLASLPADQRIYGILLSYLP